MTELHLTLAEQKLFASLPANLREGWTVVEEMQKFDDTITHRRTRVSFLKLHDPKLNVLKEQIEGTKDAAEIAKLVADFDLKEVQQADLAELFFALGPQPLYLIIAATIPTVKTDKDVESLAALSLIRNALLRAFVRNYT